MTDIDRRMVLGGVAGVGLLLSACGSERSQGNETEGGNDGDAYDAAGGCPLHGKSARTQKLHTERPFFTPDHVCAIYIRYEENGRPTIRHAYYATNAKTDNEIKPIAEMMLEKLRTGNTTGLLRPEKNFHKLSMRTQQVLVIFVDNDPAIIRFARDNNQEHVIRFTGFSGQPTNINGAMQYRPMEENHAFYNLRPLTINKGNHDHNLVYIMEFWNSNNGNTKWTVPANAPISDWKVYSMNIHLLQSPADPTAEVPVIPVVLDPDTGNMGSNP